MTSSPVQQRQQSQIRFREYGIYADSFYALGQGNYGVLVCQGKNLVTGEQVAAKRYEVDKDFPACKLREKRQAAKFMRTIPPHPNVIKVLDFNQTHFIGTYKEFIHLWLIMEYCPLGDLKTFAKRVRLPFSGKVALMIQSARGVRHLHQYDIVHSDLKPWNLLVAGTDQAPQIKIADYGEENLAEGTIRPDTKPTPFMAPEFVVTSPMKYVKSVDTFALGSTFYAYLEYERKMSIIPLVEGKYIAQYLNSKPFPDLAALITKEDDSNEVAELKRLLAAMMRFEPSNRPSINQVIDTLSDLLSNGSKSMSMPAATAAAAVETAAATAATTAEATAKAAATAATTEVAPSGAEVKTQAGAEAGAQAGAVKEVSQRPIEKQTEGKGAAARQSGAITKVTQNIKAEKAIITLDGTTKLNRKTSWIVSFGPSGEVLMSDDYLLCLYNYSNAFSSHPSLYIPVDMQLYLQHGVDRDCYKAMTCDDVHMQKLEDHAPRPTYKINLEKKQIYMQNICGSLIGALGASLVYRVKQFDGGDYVINVHDSEGVMTTLKPPKSRLKWGWGLSVCRSKDNFVVVESFSKSLDVFTKNNDYISHTDLLYVPCNYSAISLCSPSSVIIGEEHPPALHIHQLPGGQEVATFSSKELGLGEEECMCAVNYYCDKSLITLALGKKGGLYTSSLRTYKFSTRPNE